jgi:hypothetical protein
MKYKSILIILLSLYSGWAFGQTDIDALRYSRLQMIGSGRTMGVGGAFGAIGGDFTVLSSNPAGIATYRHSEISITPSAAFNITRSDFEGLESLGVETYPNLSNLGIVFGNPSTQKDSKWKTKNFAIGTNRLANYYQEFRFEGLSKGSITERFVDLAKGLEPSQLNYFEEGLAYETYVIDNTQANPTAYFTDADSSDFTYKTQDYESSGHSNEFVISFGGNYMHRLYIGGTIGVPFIRYSQRRDYKEDDRDETIPYFDELVFTEQFSTTGLGINVKLGAILRVSQMVRLGAALHSPTRMTLTDQYSASMSSLIDFNLNGQPEANNANSGLGTFEYTLRTPWRAIGSAALILKKNGFVTLEAEYLDYGNANFNFISQTQEDLVYLNGLNATIANKYGSALNVRLGGEIALSNFRLRGGYAIYGTPFRAGVAVEAAVIKNVSFGAGYHGKTIFVDFAVVNSSSREEYVPYVAPSSAPSVVNKTRFSNLVMTVGYKFN